MSKICQSGIIYVKPPSNGEIIIIQTRRPQGQQLVCFDWLPPYHRDSRAQIFRKVLRLFRHFYFSRHGTLFSIHFAIPQRKFVYRFLLSYSSRLHSLEWSDIFDRTQSNYSDWNVFFDLLFFFHSLKIRVKETCGWVNANALHLMTHWPTFGTFF